MNLTKIKKRRLLVFSFGLLIFFLQFSCAVRTKQTMEPMIFPGFDAESHRGGRGVMPENTVHSMLYSLGLDINTLEMDAHITADGKVVLSHDDYLNPLITLKPDGKEISPSEKEAYPIFKLNYSELEKFDVGTKFYSLYPQQRKMKATIPLLSEVIDSVQNYIKRTGRNQVFYNIETKSSPAGDHILNPEPEVFVKAIMDIAKQKRILPFVIIQSSDVRTLQVINKNYPGIRTSYLVGSNKKDRSLDQNLAELGFQPFIYSPNFKFLKIETVQECHKRWMKVVVWTPDTIEEIKQVKAMQVDGIITDYPELIAKKRQ